MAVAYTAESGANGTILNSYHRNLMSEDYLYPWRPLICSKRLHDAPLSL